MGKFIVGVELDEESLEALWCRHHDTGTGDQENIIMGYKSWRTNIRPG